MSHRNNQPIQHTPLHQRITLTLAIKDILNTAYTINHEELDGKTVYYENESSKFSARDKVSGSPDVGNSINDSNIQLSLNGKIIVEGIRNKFSGISINNDGKIQLESMLNDNDTEINNNDNNNNEQIYTSDSNDNSDNDSNDNIDGNTHGHKR